MIARMSGIAVISSLNRRVFVVTKNDYLSVENTQTA